METYEASTGFKKNFRWGRSVTIIDYAIPLAV
jgi:hypothetical protein